MVWITIYFTMRLPKIILHVWDNCCTLSLHKALSQDFETCTDVLVCLHQNHLYGFDAQMCLQCVYKTFFYKAANLAVPKVCLQHALLLDLDTWLQLKLRLQRVLARAWLWIFTPAPPSTGHSTGPSRLDLTALK